MAKFSIDVGDWIDDSVKSAEEAQKRIIGISKASVWEGAKVTADAVAAAASEHGNLANGLRISHINGTSDGADVLVYFEGYDDDGVAFAIKANALESGRSSPAGIVGKHPFFRKALNKSSAAAKAAMIKKFKTEMEKILND